ncbi:hypothetical protein LOTGIDRAFT_232452 [Lottia gigantea]|uniref:Transmembrane protein 87A n=1 Tax=Lottia gigantea TaxID=225164 RepID=V3ZRY5_LOTGI|nr:hypothetical protein LOTGIDRAFT_232452 [Lottia gigantea]ESO94193.1 hypothetical protein LOTGIDRAFT_232452 [Lottia gigantea]
MEKKSYFSYIFRVLFLINCVNCLPEQGVWKANFDEVHYIHSFPRSLYVHTKVRVAIHCEEDTNISIKWMLRRSPCSNEYESIDGQPLLAKAYLDQPEVLLSDELSYSKVEYLDELITNLQCNGHTDLTSNHKNKFKTRITIIPGSNEVNKTNAAASPASNSVQSADSKGNNSNSRRKRAEATKAPQAGPTPTTKAPVMSATPTLKTTTAILKEEDDYLVEAWVDGYYIFILEIHVKANVTIKFDSQHGYIGAIEWPLLVFFGVMGLMYIILGLVWLVLLACNWRDLLRVQFWVGGVLVLGMLEAAVFFGEYENITKTGVSVRGAIVFAEIVSSLKRTLARMLVIVVSLGFGIVKPRLGPTFHKVLCVGGLYFVVSTVEGCMRALKKTSTPTKDVLIVGVPLAVIDAVICWWIFSGLVQTTRTLRLRRNVVKLSLYRHFTNTLIFAVITSIIFMIWSVSQHRFKHCLTDWKELWVDVAFWHLLFLLLLFIIMILWRPSTNNQRYAFSPLLDAADEEDDENVMHDAFAGMKMRGTKSQSNGSPRQKDSNAEDDLKWVEDNIPSSITDKALPSLLDSDEEIMTTKFEMSKME